MHKTNNKPYGWIALLLALVLLAASLPGCGKSTAPAQKPAAPGEPSDEIRIGCMLTLSGDYGYIGIHRKQALELAVKEINGSGGILGKTVVLDIQDDDKHSTDRTMELMEQFKSCQAIIGPGVKQAAAINEMTKQNKQIVLALATPTYDDLQNLQNPYMFFTGLGSVPEEEAYAKFFTEKGCKKICVMYMQEENNIDIKNTIINSLQSNGIDYIEEGFQMNLKIDFSSQITSCMENGCDGMIVGGMPEAYNFLAEQMAAYGYSPVMMALTLSDSGFLEFIDAGLLRGWYTCGEWVPDPQDETAQRVLQSFHDAGINETENAADMAACYGSVYVLKDAIERCKSLDPDALSQALKETKDFNAGYLYTCDGQHRMIHRVFVMQLDENKQLHTVDIIE